ELETLRIQIVAVRLLIGPNAQAGAVADVVGRRGLIVAIVAVAALVAAEVSVGLAVEIVVHERRGGIAHEPPGVELKERRTRGSCVTRVARIAGEPHTAVGAARAGLHAAEEKHQALLAFQGDGSRRVTGVGPLPRLQPGDAGALPG